MTKDTFLKALKEKGYNADYTQNHIPTIFVPTIAELQDMITKLADLKTELAYNQSVAVKINTTISANI